MSFEFNRTGLSYELISLDETRTRTIFSILPLTIVDQLFVWTGKWFSFVDICEQRYKIRYSHFDDGLSYQNYWGQWKEYWKFVKIIK